MIHSISKALRKLPSSSSIPLRCFSNSFGKDADERETFEDLPVVADRGPLPIITKRTLSQVPLKREPRQAWVDNLDTVEEKKLGIVDLHPSVFGAFPHLGVLHANIKWQTLYKFVDWSWTPARHEMKGGGRKPWPQKKTGRARHGSIRSPIFYRGVKIHGPKGPKTHFYNLPYHLRTLGLCTALSVKLAQDDLKIVDSLEIPTEDGKHLLDLIEKRGWGDTCLFVDNTDIMPKNIALATDSIGHLNLMPVYGLNVYSMLKHETLILTIAALEKIEKQLLFHLNRCDSIELGSRKGNKFY